MFMFSKNNENALKRSLMPKLTFVQKNFIFVYFYNLSTEIGNWIGEIN